MGGWVERHGVGNERGIRPHRRKEWSSLGGPREVVEEGRSLPCGGLLKILHLSLCGTIQARRLGECSCEGLVCPTRPELTLTGQPKRPFFPEVSATLASRGTAYIFLLVPLLGFLISRAGGGGKRHDQHVEKRPTAAD